MIRSDGKIVVAGTSTNGANSVVVLARYNTDDSLDTSFGDNGLVAPPITETDAGRASGVALQTDGKIMVAQAQRLFVGTFTVSRYESDGSSDTTFGGTGSITTPIEDLAGAAAVAIQADSKLWLPEVL